MNNVLELKGKRFVQASKSGNGGGPAMNSKVIVTFQQIQSLISKLNQIHEFWLKESRPFQGILISVYYNKIVAKTNRISGIFKGKACASAEATVYWRSFCNLSIASVTFSLSSA